MLRRTDFEILQLGAFATPGLLLAQGPIGLTARSGFKRRRKGHHENCRSSMWGVSGSIRGCAGFTVAAAQRE
jgi:hypothetical protein